MLRLIGLIGLSLLLSALALAEVLPFIADEQLTPSDRIVLWISIGALPILLVALIALLVRASWASHFFEAAERGVGS